MVERISDEQIVRQQIEAMLARLYSTESIEARIAANLLDRGEFHDEITAAELSVILRNIVFVMFDRQKVAGFDVDIVHNIPAMSVEIENGEAAVCFVVHIHRPIVVFIEFSYVLINDAAADNPGLCLKDQSLNVEEKTRRFDLKAKAALTALNVPRVVRQELADLSGIIHQTLPEQLRKQGIQGEFDRIELEMCDSRLRILLQGAFTPLSE